MRLAQHLQSLGLTTEDVVTGCSYNILDSCLPLLACLYLGVKYSSLDPSQSVEDSSHLLDLVKPKLIFCGPESVTLIEDALVRIRHSAKIVVFGDGHGHTPFVDMQQPTGTEDCFEANLNVNIDDTAVILFSSGTTGLPKAICCSHAGLLSKFPPRKTSQNENK